MTNLERSEKLVDELLGAPYSMSDAKDIATIATALDAAERRGWDKKVVNLLIKDHEITSLRAALLRIARIDPDKYTDDGFLDWGRGTCFVVAQEIAQDALTNQSSSTAAAQKGEKNESL